MCSTIASEDTVNETDKRMEQVMTNIAEKIKENKDKLQPAKQKLKDYLADIDVDQQSVKDHVKVLHDQPDARQKELLDEIRQHQVNLQKIQTQLKEDDYLGGA